MVPAPEATSACPAVRFPFHSQPDAGLLRWGSLAGLHGADACKLRPAAIDAALPNAPVPQGTSSLSGTVADQNGRGGAGRGGDGDGRELRSQERAGPIGRRLSFCGSGRRELYRVGLRNGREAHGAAAAGAGGGTAEAVPDCGHRIPQFTSTVRVTATPVQIATAQVHVQEKQRMLGGVVPNFYTSFEWNAAPMTPKLKYGLALRSTFDPLPF